jgi:Rieske Fe-S protein
MSAIRETGVGRRQFLRTCAACAGVFAVSTTGCASLATRPVGMDNNGLVRLAFTEHPELTRPNGAVKVLPTGERDPVYVFALDQSRFTAVSPICTHRGCTVDIQGESLVCPCHGSTYDRQGTVLRGPAERSLRSFPVRASSQYIEIQMRGTT